tara:strand:+ start:94 stop:948 length:855 start_codon:yes stop_codon:yes gene_type:complete
MSTKVANTISAFVHDENLETPKKLKVFLEEKMDDADEVTDMIDEFNSSLCLTKIHNSDKMKASDEQNELENEVENEVEKIDFLNIIKEVFEKYISNGARSNEKVKKLHGAIYLKLKKIIEGYKNYYVKMEEIVDSVNSSGKKQCDIVILKNGKVYIIFPVKFIMTNYYQNKNNSWENLTGELQHLKWANDKIYLIPINIIFNKIPYLKNDKKIKKYEEITYEKSFKIMNILKEKDLAYELINYIIEVEQNCKINEEYNQCPTLIKFNDNTPFRSFKSILKGLIM